MNHSRAADRLWSRHSNTWRFYLLDEDTNTLALRNFEINSGTVRGDDLEGLRRIKPIRNILFAYPVEKISDVKPHIEKAQLSKSVTKMRLNKGELRQALKENIVLTMRGGYVIRGKLQKFDDYRLFMRVGNTDMQVYRYGLLNLEKKKAPSQTKTNDLRKTFKKRDPERVEATSPKKKKTPSRTKTVVNEVEQVKLILRQRYVEDTINLRKAPHRQDLKRFIELVEKEPDKTVLFSHYFIFELDNGRWGQPSNHAFVDSPYLDTGLTAYYESIGEDSNRRRALSPKYAKSDVDPERLGKFAKEVGAQTKFDAIKQEIPDNHPERQYLIDSAEGQWRYTGNNEDYIIPEFKTLLDAPSIDKSRLIWRTMCSLDESHLESWFWNNKRYMNRRPGKSSLVHDLRNAKWVPQKDGDSISFVLPREASVDRLPKGFSYEAEQKWLQVVEFGEIVRERKEEYIQQNQRAQEMGFNSGDEADTMAEIAEAWRAEGKLPEEIERIGTRKRRTERLTIELSDADRKQYEIRARSIRSTRSTIDPDTHLREQYTKINNMECQMCRQEMPFKKRNSDEDYFEAVEALREDHFPKEHEAQYLALCPECAAKYKEYVKKDRAARKVLYNLLKDSDGPEVHLPLNDCVIRIWFDEKHWHDLKTVLHYYENIYESENSTD